MTDYKKKEDSTKEFLLNLSQRAIDLRSKDRDFHGLDREFLYCQTQMLADYDKSKDIKHPRDVGNAREEILRKFLLNSGYLPKRYAVSQNSARVASTSGHISKEIDILLYDPFDSVSLMKREDVYEVFPVESVYGVIQVKSRLNKREIREGLDNLASFKRLNGGNRTSSEATTVDKLRSERGFGVLFAYDSDLDWIEIIREIEMFSKQNPSLVWCNGVFILRKGLILHGEENSGKYKNPDIEKIRTLQMFGFPDRQNQCLYQFCEILLSLLRSTSINLTELNSYFRLPLISNEYSYEFGFGHFAEFATCDKHGDFQRKIAPDQLAKLIDWCRKTEPINWIKALDIAYGEPGDRTDDYARQPGDVRIYNPENQPLSEILVREAKLSGKNVQANAFDDIRCAGMTIYLPYYYSYKEQIISGCPKCSVLTEHS